MLEQVVPGEAAIAMCVQQLAALAEGLGEGTPRRIILDARKALGIHLDAERYNRWARRVTRASEARRLRRRHQRRGTGR